jgi:hypothetical protein
MNPKGLLSEQQRQSLFTTLGLDNIPQEQKDELLQGMIDTVLNRIFTRIEPVLTEQDLTEMQSLEKEPDADQKINQFLLSRVPNLEGIAQEEIELFRDELKKSVNDIQSLIK